MSIQVNDELKPFVVESVSPESMKDWAVFLHDPNPIHLDVEVVKAKGLGDRVINQGPMNVAFILNMLQQNFPACRVDKLNSMFLDNVYGGDHVETYGKVTEVNEVEGGKNIKCEIALNVIGGGTVISGTAEIFVAS